MPTACIRQPNCSIHLKSERLEVRGILEDTGTEGLLREIPIRDVDRLIIDESVHITSAALAALLRAEIPINILAWSGNFLGGFLPATNAHGLARLRQYERTRDPAFTLQMSGRIITAKLYNQRRVLQRLMAARSDSGTPMPKAASSKDERSQPLGPVSETGAPVADALGWLNGLFASINASRSIDELRGYEGASTARYFQAWGSFLPAAFPFERRSTRPPLNPVNACISFGATVLYQEMVSCIHSHGLDPSLGLLHSTEDGRWSLALDLIEPFRPALVEALTLDLFSRQMLGADSFEARNGGIYLNDAGRKKFILQYERRMERQFMSEGAGHRTCLRQQLENQAILLKAALEDPSKFEPFLMN